MAVAPQYAKPPIKEAIFAITFKEVIPENMLDRFTSNPFISESFSTGTGPADGYRLTPKDNKNRSIQIAPTYLSYHNFNQYAGWETMFEEFKHIWLLFCKTVGNITLSQLSVRYINQIPIPFPLSQEQLAGYTNLMVTIPAGFNPDVTNFFVQVQVPNREGTLMGIITETLLPNEVDPAKLLLLLDLTVAKAGEFDCDKAGLWESFLEIRGYKNDLFEKCITPLTRNLFD